MSISDRMLLGLCLMALSAGALAADAYVFSVGGNVRNPMTLSMEEIQALPAETLSVVDERGSQSEYRCVRFLTLLERAGAVTGKELKGERLTDYILVSGADNYRVLFSLAEIDALLGNHAAYVCHTKNGSALPDQEGPLRVVVPNETRHARWVRHVTSLQTKSN